MFSNYKNAYQSAPYNMNLNYSTNNQYRGIPPKMSDNRALVASSQPLSVTDYYLKDNKTNWSYRNYLINNGNAIQKENTKKAFNDIGYYQRFMEAPTTTPSPPAFYKSIFDNIKPNGFQDSDLKQDYLTREQLNARIMTPVFNAPARL